MYSKLDGEQNVDHVESLGSTYVSDASRPMNTTPLKPSCSTAPPSPTDTSRAAAPNHLLSRSQSLESIPLLALPRLATDAGIAGARNGTVRSTSVAYDQEPPSPATSQAVTLQTSKWISSCPIYRNLNQLNHEFRLLHVQPSHRYHDPICTTLQYCSLAIPPRYLALSYCWGETSDRSYISVNGSRFAVTRNLYHALRQLRSHRYTVVWVDALCIDQDDVEEKSLQISRMPAIYRKAAQVAIWLGQEAHGSDHVMRALGMPYGFESVSLPQLQCFLERAYWQRTWVLQEIVFATRASVFCGSHILDWEMVEVQVEGLKKLSKLDVSQLQSLSTLCDLRRSRRKRKPIYLLELLRRTKSLKSTDQRDKIFAILGLASDSSDYVTEPTYKLSEHDLCVAVTTTAIEVQKSLDMILLAPGQPEESNLPSWCPDFLSANTHPFPAGMIKYLHGKAKKWRVGTRSTRWHATESSRLTSRNFKIHDGILEVYGLSLGQITGLSAPADCVEPGNEISSVHSPLGSDLLALDALCRVFKIYDPQYLTHGKQKHIFPYLWAALEPLGTALFDAVFDESTDSDDESVDSRKEYYGQNCQAIVDWFRLNANFSIQGKTLREWACLTGEAAPPRKFKEYIRQAPECDDDPDRLAMMDILDEGLRLISTNRDNLGWAHPGSRPGDWVYLLAGCSTPVVLRYDRNNGTYRLIGHAYVDGFMDGAHWRTAQQKSYSLRRLELR